MRLLIYLLLSGSLAGSLLAQDRLFTFPGARAGNWAGWSVDAIGDVNGDGWDDVIVGSPQDDTNGQDAGKAAIYSGRDGCVLHGILGDSAGDGFGRTVRAAGDIDKDGVPDYMVAAPWDDDGALEAGSVRIYSGKDHRVLHRFDGGFRDVLGLGLRRAGDVNKDGFDDVIIGASGNNTSGGNAGAARVYSGKDGKRLWEFLGDSAFDFFGTTVCGVGDLNGDGFDDVAVGAPDDDNTGRESGMARVYSGQTGNVLYTWNGDAADDFFGHVVSSAGDVDKDGTLDVIVGAVQFFGPNVGPGYARLFSGKTGAVLRTLRGAAAGDFFGDPVRGIGDLDGDGHADVVVGAPRSDATGVDAGLVRAYSGKDGKEIFTLRGQQAGALFGHSLAPAGDVNSDAIADLVVGAPEEVVNSIAGGAAQVFSTRDLSFWTDAHTVSVGSGGTQNQNLRAGSQHKGMLYIVLGSMKETSQGILIPPGVIFPLDFDAYMNFTLTGHGTLIRNSLSVLDASGNGQANFVLPTGHSPALIGAFFRHAYLVIDLSKFQVVFASNPAPLRLVQ